MFCEKCGKQLADGSLFCDGCGAKLAAAPDAAPIPEAAPDTAAPAAAVATVKEFKLDKKTLIGIGAAAVVVLVVVLAIVLIAGAGGAKQPLLYFSNEDLIYSAGKAGDGKVALPELINSDMRLDWGDASSAAWSLAYFGTAFTSDCKTLVYLCDYDTDDETYSLYSVPTKALKNGTAAESAEKISSDVSDIMMADGTDLLLYTKNGKLYCYDFKHDPAVVAKDFAGALSYSYSYGAAVSADGKTIAVLRDGDDWYDLYLYTVKTGESEKIDSDVYSVMDYDAENNFASILYTKVDEDYNETLYRSGVGTDKEKLVSKVYSILRASAGDYVFYVEEDEDTYDQTLYVLDIDSGEKEKLVEAYSYAATLDSESGLGVVSSYEDGEEIWYTICGSTASELDETIQSAVVGPDDKSLYLIESEDAEDDEGTLVRYAVGKDGLGAREKLEEDIYSDYLVCIGDYVIFSTDFTSYQCATLRAYDGKSSLALGDDVSCSFLTTTEDGGLFFFADYDSDSEEGSLYRFDGKTSTKVADDVYAFSFIELDGDIYFISDFDEDDGGTLCVWDGKKKSKLAEDVLALVRVR